MSNNGDLTLPQMRFTSGTALLFGIGARLLLEKHQQGSFLHHPSQTGTPHASILHSNAILVGLWQGVMLHQIIMEMPGWLMGVAFAIGARFVVELWMMDRTSLLSGLLGIALGVLAADLLAQICEDESWLLDSKCRICGSRQHKVAYHRTPTRFRRKVDWEVKEDVVPMNPMEREIRDIELKALEADSNRSRLEEERKWVEETGNVARAFQIAWQIRRYEGLVQSLTQKAKEMRRLAAQMDLSSPTDQLNIAPLQPVKPSGPQYVQVFQTQAQPQPQPQPYPKPQPKPQLKPQPQPQPQPKPQPEPQPKYQPPLPFISKARGMPQPQFQQQPPPLPLPWAQPQTQPRAQPQAQPRPQQQPNPWPHPQAPQQPQPPTKFVAVEPVPSHAATSDTDSQDTYMAYAPPRPSLKVREYVVEKLGSADGGVEWTRSSYRTRKRMDDDESAIRSTVSSRLVPITSVSSLE